MNSNASLLAEEFWLSVKDGLTSNYTLVLSIDGYFERMGRNRGGVTMNGQAAKAFLAELQHRKVELQGELSKIESLESGVLGFLDGFGESVTGPSPIEASMPPEVVPPPGRLRAIPPRVPPAHVTPRRSSWMEAVRDAILSANRPLSIVEIREAVRELRIVGDDVTDSSLYNSIYTALARNPDVFGKEGEKNWGVKQNAMTPEDNGLFSQVR